MWEDLENLIKSQNQTTKPCEVADVLAYLGSPSTSIAILDHGKISSRCYSTDKSHDTETVYQACSISKPIAGLAAMRLVDLGQLDLNKPISEYLPARVLQIIGTPETAHLVSCITPKQLMSHTSGLTVHGVPGYLNSSPDLETILSGRAPSGMLHVHLSDFPGHRFSYSGGGMTVLQLLLQQITSKTFPDLMRDLVFEPLGMTRSHYHSPGANFAAAHYTGYQPYEFTHRTYPEYAAAGLWTTPTDLLKAALALQKSLNGGPSTFLTQSTARLMLTAVQDSMALTMMAPASGTTFRHAGSNIGYRCDLVAFADLRALHSGKSTMSDSQGRNTELDSSTDESQEMDIPEYSGICIMTNSDAGAAVYEKIQLAILYLKNWPAFPTDAYYVSKAVVPFIDYDARIGSEWRSWIGAWGYLELSDDGGNMPLLIFHGQPGGLNIPLRPAARPKAVGGAIDFVARGLEIMIRLTEKDGERVVELWHGVSDDIRTLHRSAAS